MLAKLEAKAKKYALMADIVSPAKRSRMMAGIKGENTKPEIIVRKLLHANGYRFRLHRKDLPGKPDIVLKKHKAVILVEGCFWHGHENCHLFRLPKSRTEFWQEKIGANKTRDSANVVKLRQLDWRVMRVWECALKGKGRLDIEDLAVCFRKFLECSEPDFFDLRGDVP